jgi:hypothetical protein
MLISLSKKLKPSKIVLVLEGMTKERSQAKKWELIPSARLQNIKESRIIE